MPPRQVRSQQLALNDSAVIKADMEGLEFMDEGGFNVHLDKRGAVGLGQRMGHAYLNWLAQGVRGGLMGLNGAGECLHSFNGAICFSE